MAAPTWSLHVDWDNAGDYSNAQADVTSRIVGGITTERGYDFDNAIVGGQTPGRLRVTLDNESGDYSFSNNAIARSGCLVQLRWSFIGQSGNRWTGYLTQLEPDANTDVIATATLEARGLLQYINEEPVRIQYLPDALTSDAIRAILTASGVPMAQQDIRPGASRIGSYYGDDDPTKPSELLADLLVAEVGHAYENKDGGYSFRSRHDRITNTTSMAVYSDAGAANSFSVSEAHQENPLDSLYSQFEANVRAYEAVPTDNALIFSLGRFLPIGPAETVIVDAIFTPTEDWLGVAEWQVPEIVANSNADGTGTDLLSNLTITRTDYATASLISIHNTSMTEQVYIVSLDIWGMRFRALFEGAIRAESPALRTQVGRRLFPKHPTFDDPTEASYWTQWTRLIYEDNRPVVTITVQAYQDDAHLIDALNREIGDRVTLDLTGSTQLGISGDFFIEAIADPLIDEVGDLTVQYKCVSVGPIRNYALTDTAMADQAGVLTAW